MKWFFVIRAGLFLGAISLTFFALDYVFSLSEFSVFLVVALVLIIIALLVVRDYSTGEPNLKSWFGFIYFFLNFFFVFMLAIGVNILVRYAVYNHLDPDFRFARIEKSYQKLYERRIQKGLPLPDKPNPNEIVKQHSFTGLVVARKTEMVLMVILAILAYLPALFFHHLHTDLGPRRTSNSALS
jgi:hypothetical protein